MIEMLAAFAITFSIAALAVKLSRYGLNRLVLAGEMTPRANAVYPPDSKSLVAGLWQVNVTSYKFWWQANPVMFIGHVLYHAGLFTALGIYVLVGMVAATHTSYDSIPERVIAVCDWLSHKDVIFTGAWQPLGQAVEIVFGLALVSAVIGITTPFAMTLLHKRGAIRPLDPVMAAAGIKRIPGLKSTSSFTGYQRKSIGLMVLGMDWLMLIAYLFPVSATYTCAIHLSFTFTLVALMPTSFLFHEIYRVRMFGAVRRVMDGRTA